jgi:precorrin-6B methylase 2
MTMRPLPERGFIGPSPVQLLQELSEPALRRAEPETAAVMDGVGRDHGLIRHAAASTPAGLLMVNLWRAESVSQAAAVSARNAHRTRAGPSRTVGIVSSRHGCPATRATRG